MVSARILPILLVAVAACAKRPAVTTVQPLIPKNGPEASVRAQYQGGLFNRSLTALFRVERPAYVMVAHLGGDGVIRVLFPEDARESGWLQPRKLFRSDIAPAAYDALPGFWFLQPHVMRNAGARIDSYDGNGHGFVFMIASNLPLRFDRVSEFGLWSELEFTDYPGVHDPRELVRTFANVVSPSGRYTLDYASSMSSYSYYGLADSWFDCSVLSSGFGVGSFYNFDSFRFSNLFEPGSAGCGSNAYFRYAHWLNVPAVSVPVASTPPTVPDRPVVVPRPGRRDPLLPDRGGLTRPTFAERASDATDRRGGVAERRGTEGFRIPRERGSTFAGERVYPAPATPFRGTLAGRRPERNSPSDVSSMRGWNDRERARPVSTAGSTSQPAPSNVPVTEGTVSVPRAAPGSDRRKP